MDLSYSILYLEKKYRMCRDFFFFGFRKDSEIPSYVRVMDLKQFRGSKLIVYTLNGLKCNPSPMIHY